MHGREGPVERHGSEDPLEHLDSGDAGLRVDLHAIFLSKEK